jgi:hypothetical protein
VGKYSKMGEALVVFRLLVVVCKLGIVENSVVPELWDEMVGQQLEKYGAHEDR